MSVDLSLLGQATDYPRQYAPQILFPIARAAARQQFNDVGGVRLGMDWWHLFEVSWLNMQGVPQVAMVRLAIPADSPCIVESKSLKLYCNSLNFTTFTSADALIETIERDISACVQQDVRAVLYSVDEAQSLPLTQPDGVLLDHILNDTAENIVPARDVDSSFLRLEDAGTTQQQTALQVYHSHLLRSNCPVTNQPDWGTVLIAIDCPSVNQVGLLQYMLSYREHNGFHEQCVEQIFADLTRAFSPATLMVRAWYTRRGGIDINPCRVSDLSLLPAPSRLNRQ